jgi:hypothetical protein
MKSSGYLRTVRRSLAAPTAGWACLLLLFCAAGVRASDLPAPVTLDLPLSAGQALPGWLGKPETPATTFATLNLPILTPNITASLLVTVYFQEKPDGFMRVAWRGTQDAQLLSDNFYENIGMANQRSLLISPSTLLGDGILTFQCGDSTLGIQRIKLEWLEARNGLVSPRVQDLLVTPSVGPTQSGTGLNGQANPAGPGAWENDTVTIPLTDQAVRIEQGVEFNVDLDQAPGSARLALKEAGLPFGKRLVVWINQQRAGTVTPTVPDLSDGGFLSDETGSTNYTGWRDGSFFVPVSLLKPGANAVQLSTEDESAPAPTSADVPALTQEALAIKGMTLQLNYPPLPAKTAAPAAQLSSGSATSPGLIAPAESASAPSEMFPTEPLPTEPTP